MQKCRSQRNFCDKFRDRDSNNFPPKGTKVRSKIRSKRLYLSDDDLFIFLNKLWEEIWMDILENLGKGRVRENFLLDQSRYNDGIRRLDIQWPSVLRKVRGNWIARNLTRFRDKGVGHRKNIWNIWRIEMQIIVLVKLPRTIYIEEKSLDRFYNIMIPKGGC